MGLLAESKRSSKISRDPNNTKWTKNTNSFGQKIMRSQGWAPGQYLGAQDAPHSELHTAANASYIRVTLKDDMKGLGFKKAKEDEITGLDVFSDLLSRLNGKSEEAIEEVQQARLAVKANMYMDQRWGPMRFVRGGLLVGDKLKGYKENGSKEQDTSSDAETEAQTQSSKKRKALSESQDTNDEDEVARKKRRKQERKAKKAALAMPNASEPADPDEEKRDKRCRKSKKEKSEASSEDESPAEETKADRKARRRERKEKKRKAKEAKKLAEQTTASTGTPNAVSGASSGTLTPAGTGTSTPSVSRNFVRSRFIAQKKQAVLDTKALNQIFMVKA